MAYYEAGISLEYGDYLKRQQEQQKEAELAELARNKKLKQQDGPPSFYKKMGVGSQVAMTITATLITEPIMMNVTNTIFDLLQVYCGRVKDAGTISGMFITKTGIFTAGAVSGVVAAPISAIVASSLLVANILYRKLNKNYSKYYEIINIINAYTTLLTRISNQLSIAIIAKRHYGFKFMDDASDIIALLVGITSLFSKFISKEEQDKILEAARIRNTAQGTDRKFWADLDLGPSVETDKELTSDAASAADGPTKVGRFKKFFSGVWSSIHFMLFTNIRALGLNKDEWIETFNKMMLRLTMAYSVYMHEYENILLTHRSVMNNPNCDIEYGNKVARSKSFQCITLMGIFHPLIAFREKFLACMTSTSSPECRSINEFTVDIGEKTTKNYWRRFLENGLLFAPELNHGNMNQHFSRALLSAVRNAYQFAQPVSDKPYEKCADNKNIYSDDFKQYIKLIADELTIITSKFSKSSGDEVRVSTYAVISNSIFYLISRCSEISNSSVSSDNPAPDNYIFNTKPIMELYSRIQSGHIDDSSVIETDKAEILADGAALVKSESNGGDVAHHDDFDADAAAAPAAPAAAAPDARISKFNEITTIMQALITFDDGSVEPLISCLDPGSYSRNGYMAWILCSVNFSTRDATKIGTDMFNMVIKTLRVLLVKCHEFILLISDSNGKKTFSKILYGLNVLYQLFNYFLKSYIELHRFDSVAKKAFTLIFSLSQKEGDHNSGVYINNLLDPQTISTKLMSISEEHGRVSVRDTVSDTFSRHTHNIQKQLDPMFDYVNFAEVDGIFNSILPNGSELARTTIKVMTGLTNCAFALVNFYMGYDGRSIISKITKCVGDSGEVDKECNSQSMVEHIQKHSEYAKILRAREVYKNITFDDVSSMSGQLPHIVPIIEPEEGVASAAVQDSAKGSDTGAAAVRVSPPHPKGSAAAAVRVSPAHPEGSAAAAVRVSPSSAASGFNVGRNSLRSYTQLPGGGGNRKRKMYTNKNKKNKCMTRKSQKQSTNRTRLNRKPT